MLAVQTEDQPDKVSLPGIAGQTVVRVISQVVVFEIQYRQGLLPARRVGAISAVQKNNETAVRRNSRRRRKIIDLTRMAWNLGEEFAVRELSAGWRLLCKQTCRKGEQD